MALPKKGLRTITVNNDRYAWSATGSDYGINLIIALLGKEGQILSTLFDYHPPAADSYYSFVGQPLDEEQHFIITPIIVRQVIEYALQKGWNPQVKGPHFHPAGKGHLILRLPK
jgi:hypothetical protein